MDADQAIWTFCVADADADLPSAPPEGAMWTALRRIENDGLAALATPVPLSEFGESVLPARLNSLGWLARVARAHEAVLRAAMDSAAIVPLRICTIYRDEDGVRDMLVDERPLLVEALDALRGRQEWGVKLIVDLDAVRAAARARGPADDEAPGRGEGGAYLLRRRQERTTDREAGVIIEEVAEDVHDRLRSLAPDAVLNPPQSRALAQYEGEMVLNGAYLVDRDAVGAFEELVERLRIKHRDLGAELELTGPWPPYNFVVRDERVPEAR